jgi:hypothetical protein
MTTFANFVLASAALLVSSGALSAQTVGTADIPFGFRVPGASLPAGKYTIQTKAVGSNAARITARDMKKSVFVLAATTLTSPVGREEKSRLVFSCHADDCALAEIWLGSEGQSVPSAHRRHYAGSERLAMISVSVSPR